MVRRYFSGHREMYCIKQVSPDVHMIVVSYRTTDAKISHLVFFFCWNKYPMNHSSRLQTWFARERDGWFLMIGSSAVNSFQTVNTCEDQSPLRLRKSCYLSHWEIKHDSIMFNGKLLSTNRITVTAWFVFEFLDTRTTPYSSGQQNWHVWLRHFASGVPSVPSTNVYQVLQRWTPRRSNTCGSL